MWIPVVILGVMGVIFGTFLTFFSIKFKTEENPLVTQINGLLPNGNCGACGSSGCSMFAKLLAEGKTTPEKCAMLSEENYKKICSLLGLENKERVRMVARVTCSGGENVKKRFEYKTLKSCNAVSALFNSNLECSYGCLGLGDCVRVCPVNAITMGENGLPVINEEICIGCNRCVEECPKNIIKLVPADKKVYIACSSHDKGSVVIKACKTGCIGCNRCVKACPQNAITVVNNLAIIDYSRCDNCGECIPVCPTKTIRMVGVKTLQFV